MWKPAVLPPRRRISVTPLVCTPTPEGRDRTSFSAPSLGPGVQEPPTSVCEGRTVGHPQMFGGKTQKPADGPDCYEESPHDSLLLLLAFPHCVFANPVPTRSHPVLSPHELAQRPEAPSPPGSSLRPRPPSPEALWHRPQSRHGVPVQAPWPLPCLRDSLGSCVTRALRT